MSDKKQDGGGDGEATAPPERIVSISVLPVSVSMRAPMVDGSGGKIAYSNHDVGITAVPLATPIEFTVGDKASEDQAVNLMLAAINVVARAVAVGFQNQTDRLVRHDPTRPSPPKRL